MGAVLAKFRKEKTTEARLEELENKINEIEKYSYNTQEQKKRVVGNFLAVSIGVYVIAFITFYFVYFPPTWKNRIIYSMPLLIFPIVIFLLRRLFTWYFERQLNKNSKKVSALRAEKKKILEQVMDKETYKVAVNLLSRFADKTNGAKLAYSMTPRTSNTSPHVAASYKPLSAISGAGGSQIIVSSAQSGSGARTPLTTQRQLTLMSQSGSRSVGRNLNNSFRTPQQEQQLQLSTTPQLRSGQELRRRTPFPIINQQDKGVFERIVDVLIGDGPQDRFAMICKECLAHNGMALREEFEYTSFRCAFCNAMNPSRKARPVAPRLPEHQHLAIKPSTDLTSSPSSSSSDEDSGKVNTQRLRQVPTIELTEESNISNIPHAAASTEMTDSKSEQNELEQKISAVAADANAVAEDKNDHVAEALDDDVVDNNYKELHESEPVLTDAELQERQTIEMSKLQDEFKKLMPEFEKSEDCFTNEEQELETRN